MQETAVCNGPEAAGRKLVPIDLLAHADFSGRLRHSKHHIGYAAFATTVDLLRRENPAGTLLLDAGDAFCTTFWGGSPCVRAVSLLGTDVMTLGNHEFDRGQAFLNACIGEAGFPILCANVVERATGALIPGTRPYVLLERAGVRIGVLGITTEYTPYMVTAASFAPYEVRSAVEACRRFVPQMRREGAEITVLLAHVPFYTDGAQASGELVDILREIPPVDVCIGGHIPGDYAGLVGDTVLLKGGFAGKSLCHARLWFDPDARKLVRRSYRVLETDPDIVPEEPYRAYEAEVTAPFSGFFEDVLATTDETWRIRLSAETRLGNFLAGCVQEAAGTQIAYLNATSAGGAIEPGPVTAEDVTEVMGFNDPILCADITGEQLYRLFELVYEPSRFGNNAGLLFAGLVVYADHTKPAFSKIQKLTLADGTPVERGATYTVATSEYMASGGNDTGEVANALTWRETGVRVYDALFDSIRRHGGLYVSPEQRLHEIGRPENDNSPF